MSRTRPSKRKRRKKHAALKAEMDRDPDLDGDGLHPIIERGRDITLLNKILDNPEWKVPEVAKTRIPVELTRMAAGLDSQNHPDPTITVNERIRAALAIARLDDANTKKILDAIKEMHDRERLDKGVQANNTNNVQVVLYLPERGRIEDYEVKPSTNGNGSLTSGNGKQQHATKETNDGNGQAKREDD